MPNATTDWKDSLAHFLINAGTQGRKQSEITKRFQSFASAKELREELEQLQGMGKVDKYNVPPLGGGGGRGIVYWRANTKMKEM